MKYCKKMGYPRGIIFKITALPSRTFTEMTFRATPFIIYIIEEYYWQFTSEPVYPGNA